MRSLLRSEWPLGLTFATTGIFLAMGQQILTVPADSLAFAAVFAGLLFTVTISIFAVVRHAEHLAQRLGEPLGTLILTIAITGVEVMIIVAAMSADHGSPTLARDAMLAVVMIVLNGMVGITLLVGGFKYHEQDYNLQGASAFLAVILPLCVIGLIIPNFTHASAEQSFSAMQAAFIAAVFAALYGLFLAIQNVSHRSYFRSAERRSTPRPEEKATHSSQRHALLLVLYIVPLVILAEKLALPLDLMIRRFEAPPALAGLLVAALILAPESAAAIRSALANDLQRSVNVLLGSVLASTGLTIPAVLIYGLVAGKPIILGVEPVDIVLLSLTLVLSAMTFSSNRTNILLGGVHLVLFLAYVMLIFQR